MTFAGMEKQTVAERYSHTRTLCFGAAVAVTLGITQLSSPAAEGDSATRPAMGQISSSDWRGYTKQSFTLEGHPAFVVEPKIPAPGRPWVWRTSFPDFHAEVDLELLRNGCYVGFVDCVDLLGADAALDLMDRFYDQSRRHWQLSARPALEGVSRGGLHAYRYAARHPERVACIYADTPVMDLKSWPKKWPGAQDQWRDAMRVFGFADEAAALAFKGNPVDLMTNIAQARIPLRHVISLNDKVVPPEENTLEAQRRLVKLGHSMDLVTVQEGTAESNGHHFQLPEVFASARFILRHTHVLPNQREYFALRNGLPNAKAKFERGEAGRIAFLGGSITFNPGWRTEVMRYLQQRFPRTKFDFVPAGVPSLGSVPNAFRLERDVLSRGPVDLLFVEAAVNDTTNETDTNRMLRGMEGIVRHARISNPMADIVQMHFVMPEHMADYHAGRVPASIAQHEKIAASLRLSLPQPFARGHRPNRRKRIRLGDDFRDLHPSPFGQQVYAAASRACSTRHSPRPPPAPAKTRSRTPSGFPKLFPWTPRPLKGRQQHQGLHTGFLVDAGRWQMDSGWVRKCPGPGCHRAGSGIGVHFRGRGRRPVHHGRPGCWHRGVFH